MVNHYCSLCACPCLEPAPQLSPPRYPEDWLKRWRVLQVGTGFVDPSILTDPHSKSKRIVTIHEYCLGVAAVTGHHAVSIDDDGRSERSAWMFLLAYSLPKRTGVPGEDVPWTGTVVGMTRWRESGGVEGGHLLPADLVSPTDVGRPTWRPIPIVNKNRPPQTCTLLSLPTEIIISIALHLSKSSPADFASLARTCSTLRYLPLPRSARYLLTLTAARAFQRGLWAQCRTPHQPPNQNDTFWLALEQAFIQPIEEALREESMGSSGREIWDWWSHGEGWRSRRRVWWSIVKGCAAARDAYWWLSKGLND